jgi:RNA polymerase sigma-70 factor (ECF subfamily)
MAYSEEELIGGCRKGQLKYQEALYRQFYGFAMSVCLRYAPCREDALEILNDSFMKVFDRIGSLDDDKSFRAWFRRILVNTALDHYRANRRYRLHIELDLDQVDENAEIDYGPALTVEEIMELLDQLTPIQRLVFNLHKIEGYPHEEIAGMLHVAPGTSRSHLSRAIKRLASLFLAEQNHGRHETI